MTHLNCSVSSCLNNENYLCSRSNIKVDGQYATNKESTSCNSFAILDSSFSNSAYSPTGSPETEIKCDVKNCEYNEDGSICTAGSITVDGDGADSPRETRCSTFKGK